MSDDIEKKPEKEISSSKNENIKTDWFLEILIDMINGTEVSLE
jgi:hypothetical protein